MNRLYTPALAILVAMLSIAGLSCSNEDSTQDNSAPEPPDTADTEGGLTLDESVPDDLDVTMISRCAWLSKIVYEEQDTPAWNDQTAELESLYSELAIRDHHAFEFNVAGSRETLKSFLIVKNKSEKTQIVAIAGTDGTDEWLLDMDYAIKDYSERLDIHVHEQFNALAEQIYDTKVKQHLSEEYSTYVTGHSLGGAVATIIGLLIEREGPGKLAGVITFGQPKFTNYFEDGGTSATPSGVHKIRDVPLVRVVNSGDPVPGLPPFSATKKFFGLTGSYAHVGSRIVFTDDEVTFVAIPAVNTESSEDRAFKPSRLTEMPEVFAKAVNEHSQHGIDVYLQNARTLEETVRKETSGVADK